MIGFVLAAVLISSTVEVEAREFEDFSTDRTAKAVVDQGYTTILQAVKQFEEKYGRKIKAPTDLPTNYAVQRGRVFDNEAKLELEYTHQAETLLVLVIARDERLGPSEYHETVELQDGTKAYYRVSHPGFHQLHFRKGDLVYKVWASSKSKHVTSSRQLIKVANSAIR